MRWRRLLPTGLAAQFTLLLLSALIATNLIAAFIIAREGSEFDRMVRVQRDMGRLTALVSSLEETDLDTGLLILERTGTGYTRFSIDNAPIGPADAARIPEMEAEVAETLSDHALRVIDPAASIDSRMPLMLISVQLNTGVHAGKWLNSLVYPLTPTGAWWQKIGFFIPLAVSLGAALSVGLIFILRMTRPLKELAQAARAAGRGDRSARVQETGAGELRQAAAAFNDMQQRIADFDVTRRRLLAAIGHDLRTPITGLRLRAEMLEDTEAREPMIRILEDMTVMTDDLLRYARAISQGEDRTNTDLAGLLARVTEDRGARLLHADPVQLTLRPVAIARTIGNLIDNALRYGGSASVRLTHDGSAAVITVEDNGPGIPEDQLITMLEPFVRGDDSRSADTGGAGLGLAIARSITVDHGGSLRLVNRRGGGLRAEVRLPCPASAGWTGA